MSKAIVVHQHGGPEVLGIEDVTVPEPGAGEIRVRHRAIGLNFIDVYYRTGLYKTELPFVPGNEAAGDVVAVGPGVREFAVGDRIVYNGPIGAYAEERVMPADQAIPLPDDISYEAGAAMLLKGLTAYYLLHLTWPLRKGETILFHAAAGGVGLIACQWANAIGATVIGTVGSDDKARLAAANGCHHTINYREENFVDRVREITGGKGVDVVYDSIGKDTFEDSLDCLRKRGLMVSFGNATGPVSIPNLGILAAKGSLFVTRPTIFGYFSERPDLLDAATQLFKAMREGTITPVIGQRYRLSEAAEAQSALENRKTTGSTLLIP
ncbi:MAG TPA: quinone oxidoreductase [Devosiaceae bacterium]